MKSTGLSRVLGVFLVAALAGCSAGGGSTGGTAPPSSITSVAASCTPATVNAGQTSQCTATVQGTGSFNSAVTWSVQGSGKGSINSSGLYSAPATVAASTQVTIVATSIQDSTKSGTAAVTVNPAPSITGVSVSCTPATVNAGQTSQCTATVQGTGSFNSAVTWSVQGSGKGSINSSGLYSAPATVAVSTQVTIVATSIQDSTKSGTAAVTVNPAPSITGVSVSCTPATVFAGQTSQCTATVQGTGNFNSAVTWGVQGSGNGSISSSGLYTAPATVQSAMQVTVTATSVGDPTKTGSAAVTVAPPLTVSIHGAVTAMVLGGSQTMTASSNNPGTTFAWSVTCLPANSLSSATGSTTTLNVPTPIPGCFNPVVTLAGTLGTATAAPDHANITLTYPPMTANIPNIWQLRPGVANLPITGSGFYPGGTFQLDGAAPITLNSATLFTGFTLPLGFGNTNFTAIFHTFTGNSPQDGHGGGSVTKNHAFLGGQEMAGCSSAVGECFHLRRDTGITSLFDFTGKLLAGRDIGTGNATAMTVDDKTGNLFVVNPDGSINGFTHTGEQLFDPTELTPSPRSAISAQNNSVCAVSDQANSLSWFDASQSATTKPVLVLTTVNVSTPMAVASTTTGNNESTCVVLNAGNGTLAIATTQSLQQVQTVALPGFTPIQGIVDTVGKPNPLFGGWGLKMIEFTFGTPPTPSAPGRVAMVLSRFDHKMWLVTVQDRTNVQVTGPFSINGDPLYLAVDGAQNGIISLTDAAAQVTRFARITLAGVISSLTSVSPVGIVAQGVVVPPGTQNILICAEGQCSEVPNN
jgi:hypothetical protein